MTSQSTVQQNLHNKKRREKVVNYYISKQALNNSVPIRSQFDPGDREEKKSI